LIAKLSETMTNEGVTRENIMASFKKLDQDGNQTLSFKEFRALLHKMNVKMTPKTLSRIWDAIDHDKSGEITSAEFLELMFTGVSEEDKPQCPVEVDDESALEASPGGDEALSVSSDPVFVQEKAVSMTEMHTRLGEQATEIEHLQSQIAVLNTQLATMIPLLTKV
ncbi:hypothetical protein CYMTET_53023, partial [Cymbomonas tetramitiformis]